MTSKQDDSPTLQTLHAFGCEGKPELLPGGEGNSYRCGDVVLKPVLDEAQVVWQAEIYSQIKQDGFRLAEPIRTIDGDWTHQGWQAFSFVDGKEVKGQWQEKISVCRQFHKAISHIPRPDFIDQATHPWAVADRMIWGEQKLEYGERLKPAMERLLEFLKPIDLKSQLIHGDMTGNILFRADLPPAVIDFSPYYRPTEYAAAIIIVDAIVWEGAKLDLIELLPATSESHQLLIRATMWRIKTTEEYIRQFGRGNLDDVRAYSMLIDRLETLEEK